MTIRATVAMACIAVAAPALAQQAPADPKPVAPAAPPAPAAQTAPAAPAPAPAVAPAPVAPKSDAPKTEAPKAEAPAGTNLPPVEVIQEKPKPKPAPKVEAQPAAKKKPTLAEPAAPAAAPAPKAAKAAAPQAQSAPPVAEAPAPAPAGNVEAGLVKMSPVGGSEIPISKVPGGVATVSAADIQRTGAVTPQEALQARVPGIVISDLQGNAFQTNIQYRGFDASPVNGVSQGLAIYQNGVRINEAWGDTVNFDFLPSNAINDITVVSGNPVFGLNAVGGAIGIGMKDGFNYQGAEIDTRFGSFGRRQVSTQAGLANGPFGVYAALEAIHDNGFRDLSSSNIRRMYGDIGAKGSMVEAHLNFTGARNDVGALASSPVELLGLGWNRVYTNPQTTRNELEMVSGNVSVKPSDTLTLSGIAYYRHFKQSHVDGNIGEFVACGANPAILCAGDPADNNQLNGGTIAFNANDIYGSIDRTKTETHSYGLSVQAVDKTKLFGFGNQFLIGVSYDHGRTNYGATSELGLFGQQLAIHGTGTQLVDDNGDIAPRGLRSFNDYTGVYFSNTLDISQQLAFTVGGRFNYARLQIDDVLGTAPDVAGTNTFSRFNPMVGGTYKLVPGLTVYAGYSEANRAPTPAELSCSDPNHPCIIESFLVSDPPLKQVVSHTVEAGLRGEMAPGGNQKIDWSLGFFRTENTDDIYSVYSAQAGRGYFTNIGTTLRQGVEAAASYRSDKLFLYGTYSFVDATFQSPFTVDSPNNPLNPSIGDPFPVDVAKGSHMPGIPAHRVKLGFDYWLTDKWKFGSDVIITSSQYFIGDEANQNAKLSGYQRVDLHTSYDVTKQLQVYGIFQNVLDNHYGVTGTYFNTAAGNAPGALSGITFSDPRSITPAAPFAAYGGVKLKF